MNNDVNFNDNLPIKDCSGENKIGDIEEILSEEELAALIAAAVSMYREDMGTGAANIIVKRILRTNGNYNPWIAAAVADCMASRNIY